MEQFIFMIDLFGRFAVALSCLLILIIIHTSSYNFRVKYFMFLSLKWTKFQFMSQYHLYLSLLKLNLFIHQNHVLEIDYLLRQFNQSFYWFRFKFQHHFFLFHRIQCLNHKKLLDLIGCYSQNNLIYLIMYQFLLQ